MEGKSGRFNGFMKKSRCLGPSIHVYVMIVSGAREIQSPASRPAVLKDGFGLL